MKLLGNETHGGSVFDFKNMLCFFPERKCRVTNYGGKNSTLHRDKAFEPHKQLARGFKLAH